MARFGNGARVSRCKGFVGVCSLLLILAALQQTQALSIVARVHKVSTDTNVALDSSEDYFEFHGRNITIYCYCTEDSTNSVRRVTLRQNDSSNIVTTESCGILVHDLTINYTHEGWYQCVTEFMNGTFQRTSAGTLHAIDPSIIHAPRLQYGLLNTHVTLNCSVSISGTASFQWTDPQSLPHSGSFSSVQLSHEGNYKCEVFLSDMNLVMERPIQFVVIVPPTILQRPEPNNVYTANNRQDMTIRFHSKTVTDTHISWYKDDVSIQDNIPGRHDDLLGTQESTTQLTFDPISRSNEGEYRVIIENSHPIIPSELRSVEIVFTVRVSILPATPEALTTRNISDQTALLTWTVPSTTTDDYPDYQIIEITGTGVMSHQVAEDIRTLQLELIPGQTYSVQVVTWNRDGNATSEPFNFQTLAGAPLLTEVEVRRSGDNNIHLTATLRYTGGGTITHFIVHYRPLGTETWVQLEQNFTAIAVDDELTWRTEVVDERFQDSAIELRVFAVNSNNNVSNSIEQPEEIELPGAPEQVDLISSDYEFVVLRLQLSAVGTTPLTAVGVEFHSPYLDSANVSHLQLYPGHSVEVTVLDLEEDTEYTVTLAVFNYGGKGMPSQHITFTTSARPPLAVHGIALVAVSGGVLLIALLAMVIIIWKKCADRKRQQRAYSVAQAENKRFPVAHDLVKQGGKMSPLSPVSPTPPTPSTATSILTQPTPRPSPPGFCPTPAYCSSSAPYLPNGHTPVNLSSAPHVHSAFKFDAGSSRSNSVNQDSDVSESSSPRYTYTFPRSVEGTPQIGRACDKIDLPLELDKLTALENGRSFQENGRSFPDGRSFPENGRGYLDGGRGRDNMLMQAYHASHERLRDARGYPGSAASRHKVAAYVDIDSPQLRTQSNHSVATTQTRLTCSDSSSTRESLATYPPMKNNTTNV